MSIQLVKVTPRNNLRVIKGSLEMSEQRFTDEQLDRLLRDLDAVADLQSKYTTAGKAADAIRQLRERASLLEGERADWWIKRFREEYDAHMKTCGDLAALRSQLDEARAQIADMEASPNWLSALADTTETIKGDGRMSGQNDAAQPDKERDLHGAALSLTDTTPEQFRRMGLQHHRDVAGVLRWFGEGETFSAEFRRLLRRASEIIAGGVDDGHKALALDWIAQNARALDVGNGIVIERTEGGEWYVEVENDGSGTLPTLVDAVLVAIGRD
jgi:hypothetical protein